jgi:beta-glucosidase
MIQFPDSFRWGTATASYQIEGAADEDGRGKSIWDTFCATPGKVKNNDSGAVACDHYHRYPEDVELLRSMGVNSYRFSIAWPRILPQGRGQVNQAGLDFYDRLVDKILAAGIEPYATLYHWDLPQTLQDEVGGWNSRETVQAYVDYTNIISQRLGDRVKNWITHNEPWCTAFLSNEIGEHAPGYHDPKIAWQVSHHLLLSHGLVVPILRENSGPEAKVGITLNLTPVYAATDSEADKLAARFHDGRSNRWFLDPIFKGQYPADMLEWLNTQGYTPHIEDGDAEIIARPIDFLGINYYMRNLVHQKDGAPLGETERVEIPGAEYTEMGWEVYSEGIHDLLVRVNQDYSPKKIYITENGAAYADTVDSDGHVHDERRLNYIREHLRQIHRAIGEGVPMAGYFAWSLMDNFEWAFGYEKRFGLVYVDYPTQQRIIKDSGLWYHDVATANGFEA